MKHLLLAITALLLSATVAQAQQSPAWPHGLSDEEKVLMQAGDFPEPVVGRGITSPPPIPVRTMAEWEEIQTLCITWYSFPKILSAITAGAMEECEVLIICADSNVVITALQNNGVTPNSNVTYLEAPYDNVWIRDFGPHTVYYNDVDSLALVDWKYNRIFRPLDDQVPAEIAAFKNMTLYETTTGNTDLVNTGGNWMVDGMGTAFASELILTENGVGNEYGASVKTEAEIDQIVSDFHGIDRYIKMPVLPWDEIHHIDMHMKLIDEETILVSKYPDGVADGPQIEANIEMVVNDWVTPYGRNYDIKWITVPPGTNGAYPDQGGHYRTYSNQVFVNNTILLPTYREEYDTTAIRVLGELMPGYTIVPIDVDGPDNENMIASLGAIHCITKAIGVDDPLLIQHQRLRTTIFPDARDVDATIQHASGIESATLYYRTDPTDPWTTEPMFPVGGNDWTAGIPGQPGGTTVYYYIEAEANNGKTLMRPLVSPEGSWRYDVIWTPAGIGELSNAVEFARVYPNPASALTVIHLEAYAPLQATVTVFDLMGKIVRNVHSGQLTQGSNKFFFDAADLASGVYTVQVATEHGTIHEKILVQ